MLIPKILSLIILLLLFIQDAKSREVHWLLFPLLVIVFMWMRIVSDEFSITYFGEVLENNIFLALQGIINTPQDAFRALAAKAPPGGNVKFSDIRASKIGMLDAYAVNVSVAQSDQGPASELDLRWAPLPDGKVAYLSLQTR